MQRRGLQSLELSSARESLPTRKPEDDATGEAQCCGFTLYALSQNSLIRRCFALCSWHYFHGCFTVEDPTKKKKKTQVLHAVEVSLIGA